MSELTGYWFTEQEAGYRVYLELPFHEVFENQDFQGNFEYEGLELKRDWKYENILKRNESVSKLVKHGPLNRQMNDALALHPEQVNRESFEYFRSIDPGITLRSDGGFNLSSRRARKKLIESRGCYDRDGGYSD